MKNKNKIRKDLSCLIGFIFLGLLGCASVLEDMDAYSHNAFLKIGIDRSDVDSKVQHIIGKPIQELYIDRNTEDEIKTLEYNLSTEYNLILYFHKEKLFQASLHKPGGYRFPDFRADFRDVSSGQLSSGPAGYMLIRRGKYISFETLWEE